MEQISTIRDLVGLWPSRACFADEVRVPCGRVHKWISANAVPARHHLAIVLAARMRGFDVDSDLIVRLHAEMPDAAAEDAA